MKVVFIGTDKSIITQNGDARRRQLGYAKYFDELIIVVFSLQSEKLHQLKTANLIVIPTNSRTKWTYFTDSLRIISNLEKIDVISAQGPFIEGLVGVLAKFFWGIKFNVQLHIDMFDNKYFRTESSQNFVFFLLAHVTLFFADSIRVGSQRLKKWPKAFLARVPMDTDFFWHTPRTKTSGQIVSVGRLVPQKNYQLLMNISKKFPKLRFVIIGDGPLRQNFKADNLFFIGHKSPTECKKIFLQSDIFLSTSNYEGWGMAMTEALASGLPIVTTDTGCAGELIVSRKIGGMVTKINDAKEITKAIKELMADIELCRKLAIAGQAILRKDYQTKKLTEEFVKGLKNTL